ncbi:hypothetical protein [Streptomyces hirsutus]|uniref:hypothetical protein n=1 Tax=Streptomyces hirsutus TaxID=35620 RepID=UPI0006E2A3D4|nr:hypothetical protein [Streptomyces hirsutus]
MSGRADSDLSPDTRADDADDVGHGDDAEGAGHGEHGEHGEHDDDTPHRARRARWAAVGAGAVLTLAGTAAALLRLTGSVPAFVPAAYACGAGACALAAVLGSRGRTRRALWLLIAGLMVMALGDQFD